MGKSQVSCPLYAVRKKADHRMNEISNAAITTAYFVPPADPQASAGRSVLI